MKDEGVGEGCRPLSVPLGNACPLFFSSSGFIPHHPTSLVPVQPITFHPSSFILHPSAFILHPSSFSFPLSRPRQRPNTMNSPQRTSRKAREAAEKKLIEAPIPVGLRPDRDDQDSPALRTFFPECEPLEEFHPFQVVSDFEPAGDQPQAIEKLVQGLLNGLPAQTLLGATGTGKTFTIANVIEQVSRPTLVLAPNKTLAAQLY